MLCGLHTGFCPRKDIVPAMPGRQQSVRHICISHSSPFSGREWSPSTCCPDGLSTLLTSAAAEGYVQAYSGVEPGFCFSVIFISIQPGTWTAFTPHSPREVLPYSSVQDAPALTSSSVDKWSPQNRASRACRFSSYTTLSPTIQPVLLLSPDACTSLLPRGKEMFQHIGRASPATVVGRSPISRCYLPPKGPRQFFPALPEHGLENRLGHGLFPFQHFKPTFFTNKVSGS